MKRTCKWPYAYFQSHATSRLAQRNPLPDCDLMVLPGGFSYGDYLRCGAMAAHSPIMREVIDRTKKKKGTRLLAVCNGFQMLVETGLVPGALLRNRSLKFICKQIYLRSDNTSSDFTHRFAKGQVSQVPITHGEGIISSMRME